MCAHCPSWLTAHVARCAKPCATRHVQIEDVAEWLAETGVRADWMSNEARSDKSFVVAEVLKKWEERLKGSKDGPKEADKLAARKHRLVALFRSANCFSANVHACTHGLGELVTSLVRLDKLPERNLPEGLELLAKAWDEHRGKYKEQSSRGLGSLISFSSSASQAAFWGCSRSRTSLRQVAFWVCSRSCSAQPLTSQHRWAMPRGPV